MWNWSLSSIIFCINSFLLPVDQSRVSRSFFCSCRRQTYQSGITARPPQRQSHAFVLTHLLTLKSRGKSRMQMRSNARRVNIYENELRLLNEAVVGSARAAWATGACQGVGIGIVMHIKRRQYIAERFVYAGRYRFPNIIPHWFLARTTTATHAV